MSWKAAKTTTHTRGLALRILIACTHLPAGARKGSLAGTAGELPEGLLKLGHDARLAVPSYPVIEDDASYNVRPVIEGLQVPCHNDEVRHASVKTCVVDGVPVYLIGSDEFFREPADPASEDSPQREACLFFARALIAMLGALRPRWIPEVIHVNDRRSRMMLTQLNALRAQDYRLAQVVTLASVRSPTRRLAKPYEALYEEAVSRRNAQALAA